MKAGQAAFSQQVDPCHPLRRTRVISSCAAAYGAPPIPACMLTKATSGKSIHAGATRSGRRIRNKDAAALRKAREHLDAASAHWGNEDRSGGLTAHLTWTSTWHATRCVAHGMPR